MKQPSTGQANMYCTRLMCLRIRCSCTRDFEGVKFADMAAFVSSLEKLKIELDVVGAAKLGEWFKMFVDIARAAHVSMSVPP